MTNSRAPHIVVVGAGAFGGWTALYLLRAGVRVTLVDAWGPANVRSSSGGETRTIRAGYGDNRIYTQMAARALQLWRENEQRWKCQLYWPTGVLWVLGEDNSYERKSLPFLREVDLPFEELTVKQLERRYPQMNFDQVSGGIYEKEGGYLAACRACEVVFFAFLKDGGEYREARVMEPEIHGSELKSLRFLDGSEMVADEYIFACGAWLNKLFPKVIGNSICPTRQEVFFFDVPLNDFSLSEEQLPVWIDNSKLFYGVPRNRWHGFKVAADSIGPTFDPEFGDRLPTIQGLQAARAYIRLRFPGLTNAPLLGARVCQYENSPERNFIIDRHPIATNVWLVGGGSGHGFKHGPALGEKVASLVLHRREPESQFRLRIAASPGL